MRQAHYYCYCAVPERDRLRWKRALGFWPPQGGRQTGYLAAKPKRPSRTIGKLGVWVSVAVLLISFTGCSRDAQQALDTGKKIDLTLPEPQVRVQPAQKHADIEASTEKNVVKKKVESASAAAQQGGTRPITSQPDIAPAKGVRMKKQISRRPAKKQDFAAINPQHPDTTSRDKDAVGDGVDRKEEDFRPNKGTKLYQDSSNPLHPSYRKK